MKVAIIGGGITGLSTAYYLLRLSRDKRIPLDITLIESEGRLGGNIITERLRGFIIEGGPDSFLTYKPWALEMCRELNIYEDLIPPKSDRTFILWKGEFYEVKHLSVQSMIKSDLLSLKGKIRLLLGTLISQGDFHKDEPLGKFIERKFGREFKEKIFEPIFSNVYAASVDDLSLKATMPKISLLKKKITSKLPPFMSLRYGMHQLVESIYGKIKEDVKIILNHRVVNVEPLDSGYYIKTNGGSMRFDKVIITTPSYITAEILGGPTGYIREALYSIKYSPVIVINFVFNREDVGIPLRGTGFVIPKNDGFTVSSCTWTSSKWTNRAPDDYILLRVFINLKIDPNEAVDRAYKEIKEIMDVKGRPLITKVFNWEKGIPKYTVGHIERVQSLENHLLEFKGLMIAGSYFKGIGVPDCVRQGKESAKRIISAL